MLVIRARGTPCTLFRSALVAHIPKDGMYAPPAARKIEEVAIGGLHLEVVGLIWLLVGVTAASIPDVIAAWLSQLA